MENQFIDFKDFNFKLAVINVLMYEKELITPKFDIYNFLKTLDRDIDIEKEGYDIIPEIKEYFTNLKIDINLAKEVTEIIQDGGNEIYLQICPLWHGEDDIFNITSIEDIKSFQNLEKLDLFYDEKYDFSEELNKIGINLRKIPKNNNFWIGKRAEEVYDIFPEEVKKYFGEKLKYEAVFYHYGDLKLEKLDLDFHSYNNDEESIYLVNGNLEIENNIFSKNSDGAKSLIVLGNLVCNNMGVGGQLIYIESNLEVKGLFFGDYNHGKSIVKKSFISEIFSLTDGYTLDCNKIETHLKMNKENTYATYMEFPIELKNIFNKNVLNIETYESTERLSFYNLTHALSSNEKIIKNYKEVINYKIHNLYSYFNHSDISEENLDKIFSSSIMNLGDSSGYSFNDNQFYIAIKKENISSNGEPENRNIYIEVEGNSFFIYDGDQIEILYFINDNWKLIDTSDKEWLIFSKYWIALLKKISVFQHYNKKININDIKEIFKLDCIINLDYYGKENYGFWDGDVLYRFNIQESYIDIQNENSVRYFFTLTNNYIKRTIKISDEEYEKDISYSDINNLEISQILFEKMKLYLDNFSNKVSYFINSPTIKNIKSKISKYEITYFETKYKIKFCNDYLEFLLKYNGFDLPSNCYIDSFDIRYVYGINTLNKYIDLNYVLTETKFYNNHFYPLGESHGGDFYIQITIGSRKDEIYFWDHEVGWDIDFKDVNEIDTLVDEGVLIYISKSFNEFLNQIYLD